MAVWGLSDYGRCAFGSGRLPASPTSYVKGVIIRCGAGFKSP